MVVRHYNTILSTYLEDYCASCIMQIQQKIFSSPQISKEETSTWILSDVIDVRIHEHVINTVMRMSTKRRGNHENMIDEARR